VNRSSRTTALAALLVAVAALGGCASVAVMSHIPISTMSRLSALKIADIDPELLRVAARLPEILEPRRDGVKVRIDVKGSGIYGGSTLEFILEAVIDSAELAPLSAHRRARFQLWIYRFSPRDIERLRRFIADRGDAFSVSIAVGVDACWRNPVGSAALPTTTFLKTDATGFFVLAEDLDLRSVVSDRDLTTKIPPCSRNSVEGYRM